VSSQFALSETTGKSSAYRLYIMVLPTDINLLAAASCVIPFSLVFQKAPDGGGNSLPLNEKVKEDVCPPLCE
jgi:hypothetical protein